MGLHEDRNHGEVVMSQRMHASLLNGSLDNGSEAEWEVDLRC